MIKYNGSVLAPYIRALSVNLCRVMYAPKNFQKFLIRSFFGIELDLNSFCMTGFSVAYIFVRRILERAACVTNSCLDYTFNLLERSFNSPEATGCKCCLLEFCFE